MRVERFFLGGKYRNKILGVYFSHAPKLLAFVIHDVDFGFSSEVYHYLTFDLKVTLYV